MEVAENQSCWMRSSLSGWDLAQLLERLTANAEVATVLVSIQASYDTMECEGQQMKQFWIEYIEKNKK
jgi:hypothetical protein